MNKANIYLLYLTQQEEHIEHLTDYINNNKTNHSIKYKI